jgi:hypothetical protein
MFSGLFSSSLTAQHNMPEHLFLATLCLASHKIVSKGRMGRMGQGLACFAVALLVMKKVLKC